MNNGKEYVIGRKHRLTGETWFLSPGQVRWLTDETKHRYGLFTLNYACDKVDDLNNDVAGTIHGRGEIYFYFTHKHWKFC